MDSEQYHFWKSRAREIEEVLASDLIDKAHMDKVFVKKLTDFMKQIHEAHVSLELWSIAQKKLPLLFAIHPLVVEHMVNLASHRYDHDKINWSRQAWEVLFPQLYAQQCAGKTSIPDNKTTGHDSMDSVISASAEWQKILAERGESLVTGSTFRTGNGTVTITEIRYEEFYLMLDWKKVSTSVIRPIFISDKTGEEVNISPKEFLKYLASQ
jgi:hypothetical protein